MKRRDGIARAAWERKAGPHKDRRKEANRKACREPVEEEDDEDPE